MEKGEFLAVECVLVALYLRGTPHSFRLRRRNWVNVRNVLCKSAKSLGSSASELRAVGLWDEAAALDQQGVLAWAVDTIESGRTQTVLSDGFPTRWLSILGASCPPCLWQLGNIQLQNSVSVVGNRDLTLQDDRFARAVGQEVLSCGASLVTGGAPGADRQSIRGALKSGGDGRVVVLLPTGIKSAQYHEGVAYASLAEPDAPFSAALAMERNALIYAASPLSVVVRARQLYGGTWAGATDAVRRKLTQLAVRRIKGDQAAAALAKLNAWELDQPAEVPELLRRAQELERGGLFFAEDGRATAT